MFHVITDPVNAWINRFCALWPDGTYLSYDFNIRALLAILFVALICGAIGALVVGNRMAFFSDALAHCAFAGVGLGLVSALLLGMNRAIFLHEFIIAVMVSFGVLTGLMIAFVRERTDLGSDTVIGVFYAGAIGLGAACIGLARRDQTLFNLENFIFGDPVTAPLGEVLLLGVLAVFVGVFLWFMNNYLILSSASASLALSRRVPVRLGHYMFIVVLAVMVNLSLYIVGALLINGMLIVPAAAAANLARNLRQMFWYSLVLASVSGVGGHVMSWEVSNFVHPRSVGTAGVIVVVAVLLFAVSMFLGRHLRDRVRPVADED
jgi:zinc transport system permease protein